MTCRNIIYKQICNSFLCTHRFGEHEDYNFETNNCDEDRICDNYIQVNSVSVCCVFDWIFTLSIFRYDDAFLCCCCCCRWSGQKAVGLAVLHMSVTQLRIWVLRRSPFSCVIITLRKCVGIIQTEHELSVLECAV